MTIHDTTRPAHERFGDLTYEDFRRLAADERLTPAERAGFPEALRAGAEDLILADVAGKLTALDGPPATVVEIGPGTSDLPRALARRCGDRGHRLVLVDAPEVLAQHERTDGTVHVPGRFPAETADALAELHGQASAVLVYSVLQYVADAFGFLDAAAALLAPGGRLLLGDLPNASMRNRFLASAAGAAHHRALTGRDEDPDVRFNAPVPGQLDDAMVLGLAARARAAGLHAWILPQDPRLPMANRREDLLVERP